MAKRIYRNSCNKMVAGVCSGLADYFDIDPTIVRIAWLAALFCWGTGLFAYLIAVILIPSDGGADNQ